MKVAPWPTPALAAVTVPWCISTMCLTMARPRPSPPALVSANEAWRKRSNTKGRASGRIPEPESVTVKTAFVFSWASCTTTRPPRGVNLSELVRRFVTTCWSRAGSPEIGEEIGATTTSRAMPLAVAVGRAESTDARTSAGRSSARHLQVELARDDPRDVEEIGDERVLHVQVALDGLDRPLDDGGIGLPFLEDVHPAHDRGQRGAQLVGERREEDVLHARGFLELLLGDRQLLLALAQERVRAHHVLERPQQQAQDLLAVRVDVDGLAVEDGLRAAEAGIVLPAAAGSGRDVLGRGARWASSERSRATRASGS